VGLRRALPPGFARRDDVRQLLGAQLQRIITELQAMTNYEALLDAFSHRVRSAQAGMRADFRTDVMVIGPRTELRTLDRDSYAVTEEGGKLVLKFHRKAFVIERSAQPLLDEIRRKTTFSTLDLAHPLGEAATLALVRSLYTAGFLLVNGSSEQPVACESINSEPSKISGRST